MTSDRHEKLFSGASWLLIALVLLVLALAVSYFKGDELSGNTSTVSSKPNSRELRDYVVFYKAGVFGPTNIRIHIGDRVAFQNLSLVPIRIMSNGGPKKPELADFDSRTDIPPNGEFSYTFSGVGIFGYHNLNNPEEGGYVIVRP